MQHEIVLNPVSAKIHKEVY